eukprot:GHRQ01010714.1.p4 GENE.GHRQ01010714.1~~GHRQ01010714.1.p4  ORF type:complete len:122 (-),score=24.07 GHRQ01010714.1:272-637(-)
MSEQTDTSCLSLHFSGRTCVLSASFRCTAILAVCLLSVTAMAPVQLDPLRAHKMHAAMPAVVPCMSPTQYLACSTTPGLGAHAATALGRCMCAAFVTGVLLQSLKSGRVYAVDVGQERAPK